MRVAEFAVSGVIGESGDELIARDGRKWIN
jgi:hypothetical protein